MDLLNYSQGEGDAMKDDDLNEVEKHSMSYDMPIVGTLINDVINKYESMGLTKNQFCQIIQIDNKGWDRIIDKKHQKMDVTTLIKLSQFLNIEIAQAIKIYITDADDTIKKDLESFKKYNYITNQFDLKALKKLGFIDTIKDLNLIENKIIEFFQLENIYEYSSLDIPSLYSKSKFYQSDKMLRFWNGLVRKQLNSIDNPNQYNEKSLLTLMPKMREATLNVENGFRNFIKALFECGVTVIVETYISGTSIRGGTFSLNRKPFIVLTNFNKRYDSLWFALAHELCHVINDFDEISQRGYHLTGDNELLMDQLQEDIADNFACRIFISDENAKLIEKFISIDSIVTQYAKEWNVHPSFVYGNYLYKKSSADEYKKYRKKIIDSSPAIKTIEVKEPWMKKSIQETIASISKSLNEQMPILSY
jgi:Zn-dependent peptidase ImmA (M78 family)